MEKKNVLLLKNVNKLSRLAQLSALQTDSSFEGPKLARNRLFELLYRGRVYEYNAFCNESSCIFVIEIAAKRGEIKCRWVE